MSLRLIAVMFTALTVTNAFAELVVLKEGIGPLPPMTKPPIKEPGFVSKSLKDGKPYESTLVSRSDGMESWKNSEGCEWTRSEVSSFSPAISWSNCNGNTGTASVSADGNPWPLELEREWSYSVDGGSWSTDRDCEVDDTVRVSTGLGEIDTFKVVCSDKWNTRTWYISPALKKSVYFERHHRFKGWRQQYEALE